MKIKAFHCFFFAVSQLFSQNEKGVNPIAKPSAVNRQPSAETRAVIIGISDYQEAAIPDLRFADRDAEAFANYLRSPAGGNLGNDHLQVLTNQNATAGRVAEALDGLVEQTKEGNRVIIYFAGHGDVERKTISQPGFLLCWDSPARVYMGGGTYSLAFLQEIITTLSAQNKANILVVTDACHAGKLAGSQIGGSQATAANLAKQFANEVKILSCQPNEFSLEGEQWGGGHGIFSYHLLDGLFGLADKNGDGSVSVGEIDRYLEDHVTAEAAPQSQMPMLLGSKTDRLATVDAAVLADLQKFKKGETKAFMAIASRGLEETVLAKLDSVTVKKYHAFKKAVAEKRFFPDPMQSGGGEKEFAETLYASLSAELGLAPLHGFMKRNYAAALQDDSQQVMNKWLNTDIKEISLSTVRQSEKYRNYPRYLERAAELLGPDHYLYPNIMGRKLYFEGYLMHVDNRGANRELGEQILAKYRQALHWQPESPFVHYSMGVVYFYQMLEADSAEHYAIKATELAPTWIMPYSWTGFMYSVIAVLRNAERARHFLELADRVDSTSANANLFHLNNWGVYYGCFRQPEKAEQQFKDMIKLDPTFSMPYGTLGLLYKFNGRYAEAETMLKKGIELDPTSHRDHQNLAAVYMETHRYAEAEIYSKKAIRLDSTDANGPIILGFAYTNTQRYSEAEQQFKKAILLNSGTAYPWFGLACNHVFQGQLDRAFECMETGIKIGEDFDWLQKDPDLAPLRDLPEWKVLMKKYFPGKVKD